MARVGSPSGTPMTAAYSPRSALRRTSASRDSSISAGRARHPRTGRVRRSSGSPPAFPPDRRSPAQRRASRRLDVIAQRGGFVLHLLQSVLDHVADRHDADNLLLLDHRDVAELAGGHALHDDPDGLRRAAGDDFAGHDLRQRLCEHARSMLSEHAHDIALGQDADDPAIRAEHEQRADLIFSERAYRGFEGRRGLDRNDVATLGGKNVLDVHGSPPSACSERPECRLDNARFGIEFRQLRHAATDEPPDLGEERADRCALDVNRYAALTKARLSDGTRGAARCRQESPLKRAYSPRRWLMNGRRRIRPFSAVEFGRGRDRIECGEGEKTNQESADMRLPRDRMLDARNAYGEDLPEQNIDAEPDQRECEHTRIAKACG